MIEEIDEGNLVAWRYSRYDHEDFLGPTLKVVKEEEEEPMGYTLKLDLSQYEHDRLIEVLNKESYDPAIKKILYEIIGYDQAVEEAKELARREENATISDG